jgi:flagellar biosynthetic protein FlhB
VAGERTEAPTRRRVQDARRRGQVARSREVDSAIVLLAAFGVLRFGGARLWGGLESLLVDSFTSLDSDPLTTELSAAVGADLIGRAVLILAPLLAAIAALSVAGGIAQTGGPMFSTEAIRPQLKRMNPLQGAKRLFASKQSYVSLAKALAKFVVLGGVAALVVWNRLDDVTAMGVAAPLHHSLGTLVDIAFQLVLWVALALLAIAAADFVFQRYDHIGQLRMTHQEMKDELKQTEGDPQVKAQIARLRRSLLARVMQAVPQADVVLVNPTHYAVALKYDPATSRAPVVVAKGADLIALRIREVAEEHRIPVIQNPPLARAIYRAVEVGREITPDLYEAVAEVLAFVYRLRTGRVTTRA